MRHINKLLEGIEVKWKTLEEVADVFTGGEPPSNSIKGSKPDPVNKYPIYGNGVDIYGFADSYRIDKDAVTISSIGSNTGTIYFRKACFTPIIRLKVVIPKYDNLLPRYIYHYLSSIKISGKKSSVPNMSAADVKRIEIPLPYPNNFKKSLEIQQKIVDILDKFTELTGELTGELKRELTAHKQQYNYYREQLLNFKEEEVEWKPLGEIGELIRGNGLPKSDFTETGVPAIHYGQIYTYYRTYTTKTLSFVSPETAIKLKKVDTGDVIITNTSENLEDVSKSIVYLGKEQAVTGGHATIFKPSKKIIGKFLAYYTQTAVFAKKKAKYAKGTKVIDVSANDLAKIIFPVPALEEQERIVSILDKFDILTNSISEGLSKEIESRQKQYEYYRDMLLTFPKDNLEA